MSLPPRKGGTHIVDAWQKKLFICVDDIKNKSDESESFCVARTKRLVVSCFMLPEPLPR